MHFIFVFIVVKRRLAFEVIIIFAKMRIATLSSLA